VRDDQHPGDSRQASSTYSVSSLCPIARAAGVFGETGDDEADLGIDLGRIRGADGAAEARGEDAQASDLWRLIHKARFHCDRGVAQRASGSLH
jgi:hypothetical protein